MAERVYASVQGVQPARGHLAAHGARRQTELAELVEPNDAVLARGQPRQLDTKRGWGTFRRHFVATCPTPAKPSLCAPE